MPFLLLLWRRRLNLLLHHNSILNIMEKQIFKVPEIEISYRPAFKLSEKPKITSSDIAYGILDQSWDQNRMELLEGFKVSC